VGVTPIINAAPLFLAIEEGYFEEEGLEVTPTIIQAAASAIPSLLNNELEFALISAVPTLNAASQGHPLRIVSGNDRYVTDLSVPQSGGVVAAPDSGVTSIEDLEGKTVALVGLKNAP